MKNECPHLLIFNSAEYHQINTEDILYIKSDGNYCCIHLTNGCTIKDIPQQLGLTARQIQLISDDSTPHFLQVGRQYIINADHIQSIYPAKKQLFFDTCSADSNCRVEIMPSAKALNALIRYLENPDTVEMSTLQEEDTLDCCEDHIINLSRPNLKH